MENHWMNWLKILLCFGILFTSCKKEEEEKKGTSPDEWDLNGKGIPKFVNRNYIDLKDIYRISRFRSSVGHDYSDFTESCRSKKHYFEPKATINWDTLKIYSPLAGKITRFDAEWAGTKIEIQSTSNPAFRISIFHVNPGAGLALNTEVAEGQILGTHIGTQTYSDISVIVNDPTHQGIMVSWFEVMSDAVFGQYVARGIPTLDSVIISKAKRDQFTLGCNGDSFIGADPLPGWFILP